MAKLVIFNLLIRLNFKPYAFYCSGGLINFFSGFSPDNTILKIYLKKNIA